MLVHTQALAVMALPARVNRERPFWRKTELNLHGGRFKEILQNQGSRRVSVETSALSPEGMGSHIHGKYWDSSVFFAPPHFFSTSVFFSPKKTLTTKAETGPEVPRDDVTGVSLQERETSQGRLGVRAGHQEDPPAGGARRWPRAMGVSSSSPLSLEFRSHCPPCSRGCPRSIALR